MTIVAWRVVEERFAVSPYNPFDGEGARLYGGRWNSVGIPIVYTSSSRSLALLERLVHAKRKSALLECCIYAIECDPRLVETFPLDQLPADWADPTSTHSTRVLGDQWVRSGGCPVLCVPSAVVEGESNYLLNPRHPGFASLVLGPKQRLPVDSRLLKG